MNALMVETASMKLNLGAGNDIRTGYINHDLVSLPGIDVIHDLNNYPWPWTDKSMDEVVARDLLEHLGDFMAAMEEIYRILKPGGLAFVKVPYWNSWCRHADPTHKRGFHELTFQFFNPDSAYCKERHYYTNARFYIIGEVFVLAPFSPYFSIPGLGEIRISNRLLKRVVGFVGNTLSNIILDLDMVIQKPRGDANLQMAQGGRQGLQLTSTSSSLPKRNVVAAVLRSFGQNFLSRRMLEARARAAEARQHLKYRSMPVERVFADIYHNNEWGGGKGSYYSGVGSHDPVIVTPYIQAVRAALSSLPKKPTVVDLGSGDFNVGKNFVDLAHHYYACDIVPDLQEYNRRRFGFSNVEFLCVNAVEHDLPEGDVICIRQVFQHLSNAHIQKVLEKCRKYERWIISEHLPLLTDFVPNVDISAGCGIRLLFNSGVVLTEPPFNVTGYASRVLCEVSKYGGVIRTILFERESQG